MRKPHEPHRHATEKEARKAIELRNEGYTTTIISQRLGISWTTISKAIKKLKASLLNA